jgi:hypothetical protein
VPAVFLIVASIVLATLTPWRPEPAASGQRAGVARAQACSPPRQVERTFVGFPEGAAWAKDFEPAAIEASRILRATKLQSCHLAAQQDSDGSLEAALLDREVEITAVLFQGMDLKVADVRMQRSGDLQRANPPTSDSGWILRVVRDESVGWKLVSSSAQ